MKRTSVGSNFDEHQGQDHGNVQKNEDDHPHSEVAGSRAVGGAITVFAAKESFAMAKEVEGDAEGCNQPKGEEDPQRHNRIGMRTRANDFAEYHSTES
ncbi:MAG: hypothetical protein ACJ71N_14765 [Terriglobales bacterium]